jgi:hypothetical protein
MGVRGLDTYVHKVAAMRMDTSAHERAIVSLDTHVHKVAAMRMDTSAQDRATVSLDTLYTRWQKCQTQSVL